MSTLDMACTGYLFMREDIGLGAGEKNVNLATLPARPVG